MITTRQGIKLSAIVDKLNISIKNPEATQEQVGADLIIQVVSKAHRAEQEIYSFVAEIKKCTVVEAEEVDLIKFIKDMMANPDLVSFFKSAVK